MFNRSRVKISGQYEALERDADFTIEKYNAPLKAREIWNRYQEDIRRYGCWSDAFEILSQTKKHDALDTRLALMLAQKETSMQASPPQKHRKAEENELEELILA